MARTAPPYRTLPSRLMPGGSPGVHVMRLASQPDIQPHDHAFLEIVFVESGRATHATAAGRAALEPGDVIVLRPQIWHAYRDTADFTIVNCLVDRSLLHRLSAMLEGAPGTFDLLRRPAADPRREAPVVLSTGPGERATLQAALGRMWQEQQAGAEGWEAATTAALIEVLVTACRLAVKQGVVSRPEPLTRADEAVQAAATWIESHYRQPIDLATLARAAHLSPAYLSRCFTRRMGMGAIAFMHRLRAEEACRLLQTTGWPMTEIASRVGYDEIAYFSRCFKRSIGVSPSQYRRRRRGDPRPAVDPDVSQAGGPSARPAGRSQRRIDAH